MNLHLEVDDRLIEMRKSGYSPQQLLDYFMNREPLLDDMICLNHVARICYEHGLPFSQKQLLKVFRKTYSLEYHGNKASCWKFLKSFSGKKLIKFIHEPSKKVHSLHGEVQNKAVLMQDNSEQVSLYPSEQNKGVLI